MVQEVEKDKMPGDVEVGTPLQADTQMGPVNFIVKEIKESTVVLDGNHPLAGEKLIFDLELVEIN
jgi:FKBP-type peptidyl-prolyl cis-trans isomerase SlpA